MGILLTIVALVVLAAIGYFLFQFGGFIYLALGIIIMLLLDLFSRFRKLAETQLALAQSLDYLTNKADFPEASDTIMDKINELDDRLTVMNGNVYGAQEELEQMAESIGLLVDTHIDAAKEKETGHTYNQPSPDSD